jgi:hypothetical protein
MKPLPNQRKGALYLIAAEMYRNAVELRQGWCNRILKNGLQMVLQRLDDNQWRLAIARSKVYPSDTEAAICAKAFDVPAGSEPVKVVRSERYVIEWSWREYQE